MAGSRRSIGPRVRVVRVGASVVRDHRGISRMNSVGVLAQHVGANVVRDGRRRFPNEFGRRFGATRRSEGATAFGGHFFACGETAPPSSACALFAMFEGRFPNEFGPTFWRCFGATRRSERCSRSSGHFPNEFGPTRSTPGTRRRSGRCPLPGWSRAGSRCRRPSFARRRRCRGRRRVAGAAVLFWP